MLVHCLPPWNRAGLIIIWWSKGFVYCLGKFFSPTAHLTREKRDALCPNRSSTGIHTWLTIQTWIFAVNNIPYSGISRVLNLSPTPVNVRCLETSSALYYDDKNGAWACGTSCMSWPWLLSDSEVITETKKRLCSSLYACRLIWYTCMVKT